MKKIYFLLIIFMISCKDKGIYIGGQIVNPVWPYALLLHKGYIKDTLYLDHQNKFGATYVDLEQGLYLFKYGSEFQDLYLQKNDSIFMYLDTKEFDESIIFTGRGFEKSEYFAHVYRDFENRHFFTKISALPPEEFIQKIDSFQEALYHKKIPNQILSSDFYKIVDEVLYFFSCSEKEKYSLIHQKAHHHPDLFSGFPANYYDFRKKIFTNHEYFFLSVGYYNYIYNFIENISASYDAQQKYIVKFENIQKYVKGTYLRNMYLFTTLSHATFFLDDLDNTILEKFLQCTTNSQDKKQVELFIKEGNYLKENEKILNLSLTDIQNNKINLYDLIKSKKALIYFWNRDFFYEKTLIYSIQNLKQSHPNVQFIGIYMNEDLEKMNYSHPIIFKQYRLSKDSDSQIHKQNKSSLHRSIIVDDKKNIIKSNIGLFSPNLSSFLQNKE